MLEETDIERHIAALVTETLSVPPRGMERMTYGHCNIVYDVALADRNVIVRTNTQPSALAGTERTMAALRALGLPLPHIVVADVSATRYPFAYLVLDKIPGRDLGYVLEDMTRQQMTALAEQIVGYQRLAATLPTGTGYGWVPVGERGPYPSWDAVIADNLAKYLAATEDVLPAGTEERFARLHTRFQPYLAQVPPTCFLDDTTTKNVIMQDGELQGLVDFDCVAYGDPLYLLGLLQMAVAADAPRGQFYVEELCRLWPVTPFQRTVVYFYAAVCALDFIASRIRQGRPVEGGRELAALARFLSHCEDA